MFRTEVITHLLGDHTQVRPVTSSKYIQNQQFIEEIVSKYEMYKSNKLKLLFILIFVHLIYLSAGQNIRTLRTGPNVRPNPIDGTKYQGPYGWDQMSGRI